MKSAGNSISDELPDIRDVMAAIEAVRDGDRKTGSKMHRKLSAAEAAGVDIPRMYDLWWGKLVEALETT